MLVYLFRDENSHDTFAYSTDVTGRSIAPISPRAKWSFVAAASFEDLDDNEEAVQHLRQHGIYVFRKPLGSDSTKPTDQLVWLFGQGYLGVRECETHL